MRTFYEAVTAAIKDISEYGYDSEARIAFWMEELRKAAAATMRPMHVMEEMLQDALRTLYRKLIEKGGILRHHPNIGRFTLDRVKPQLRAELDRRIMASANLIKLNREEAISQTLRRFSGWSTSVPAGGSDAVDKLDVKDNIRKALVQLPFEERRVLIDQGHKFSASLNETLAKGGGAIAAKWHSHYRQIGYNARPDHAERDGHVYAVRGNWAIEKGLMRKGDGYTDEIEQPAELPFCRCFYQYIYALRALPDDMITAKGREEMERVRAVTRAA